MPIFDRSPVQLTGATCNGVNEETGEYIDRVIQPEDVLAGIARGRTVTELMRDLNAPRPIIEHAITMVPMMMAWREKMATPADEGDEAFLPDIPDDILRFSSATTIK